MWRDVKSQHCRCRAPREAADVPSADRPYARCPAEARVSAQGRRCLEAEVIAGDRAAVIVDHDGEPLRVPALRSPRLTDYHCKSNGKRNGRIRPSKQRWQGSAAIFLITSPERRSITLPRALAPADGGKRGGRNKLEVRLWASPRSDLRLRLRPWVQPGLKTQLALAWVMLRKGAATYGRHRKLCC